MRNKKRVKIFFLKKLLNFFLTTLIIIVLFTSISLLGACSFVDNYIVKRADYDSLEKNYLDLQQEYEDLLKDFDIKTVELEKEIQANNSLQEKAVLAEQEIDELQEEIVMLSDENASLTEEVESLSSGEKMSQLRDQIKRLKKLLNSINSLLKYSYIGSSDPEAMQYTFTAFGIEYRGKYYLVTAGHCVADNFGKDGRFKFKANFSDTWIYPDLIGYKAAFWALDDYAVFYSDSIDKGLPVNGLETEDNYLVGSIEKGLSIFRNLGAPSVRGESGSPVLNEYGEVIGIYVIYGLVYTPIQLVLDLIDEYEVGEISSQE